MSSNTTLPPQAYTRETLTTAFNWLQSQPESVKKQATTPDSLVCLYARAQRMGGGSFETEAPVSSQNFMSDLKNLAEGLRQFEDPRAPKQMPFHRSQAPMAPVAPTPSAVSTAPLAAPRQPSPAQPIAQALPEMPTFAPAAPSLALNERSLAMIHEVKVAMNLSNDTEAANLMMALAYKSYKSLLA